MTISGHLIAAYEHQLQLHTSLSIPSNPAYDPTTGKRKPFTPTYCLSSSENAHDPRVAQVERDRKPEEVGEFVSPESRDFGRQHGHPVRGINGSVVTCSKVPSEPELQGKPVEQVYNRRYNRERYQQQQQQGQGSSRMSGNNNNNNNMARSRSEAGPAGHNNSNSNGNSNSNNNATVNGNRTITSMLPPPTPLQSVQQQHAYHSSGSHPSLQYQFQYPHPIPPSSFFPSTSQPHVNPQPHQFQSQFMPPSSIMSMSLPYPSQAMQLSEYTAGQIATLQSRLAKKLGPEYISQRTGPGGQGKLSYVEGWKAINLANEIFGFNGWSSQIVSLTTDFIDENKPQRYDLGVTAIIRITLRDGTFHEDTGYGQAINQGNKGQALDKAKKEAVTDGVKRALRSFGNVLGNCLYDKDYAKEVVSIKVPKVKLTADQLWRRPEFDTEFQASAQAGPSRPHPVNDHESQRFDRESEAGSMFGGSERNFAATSAWAQGVKSGMGSGAGAGAGAGTQGKAEGNFAIPAPPNRMADSVPSTAATMAEKKPVPVQDPAARAAAAQRRAAALAAAMSVNQPTTAQNGVIAEAPDGPSLATRQFGGMAADDDDDDQYEDPATGITGSDFLEFGAGYDENFGDEPTEWSAQPQAQSQGTTARDNVNGGGGGGASRDDGFGASSGMGSGNGSGGGERKTYPTGNGQPQQRQEYAPAPPMSRAKSVGGFIQPGNSTPQNTTARAASVSLASTSGTSAETPIASKPLQRTSSGKLYNSDAAATRARAMEASMNAAGPANPALANGFSEDPAGMGGASGSYGGFASARGMKRNSPDDGTSNGNPSYTNHGNNGDTRRPLGELTPKEYGGEPGAKRMRP